MSVLTPELVRQVLQPHTIYIVVLELARFDTQNVINLSLVSKDFYRAIWTNKTLLWHLSHAALSCAMRLGLQPSRRRKTISQHNGNPRQLAVVALRTVARLRAQAESNRLAAEAGEHLRFKLWSALTAICAQGGVVSGCKHLHAQVAVQIEGRTSTFSFVCSSCHLAVDVAGAALEPHGLWVHHLLQPLNRWRRRRYWTVSKVGTRRRRVGGISITPTNPTIEIVHALPHRDASCSMFSGQRLSLDLTAAQIQRLNAVIVDGRVSHVEKQTRRMRNDDDNDDSDSDSDRDTFVIYNH